MGTTHTCEFKLSIRLFGRGLDFNEIEAETGISGTQKHVMGEVARTGRAYKRDIWIAESPFSSEEAPAVHLRWYEQIVNKQRVLDLLRKSKNVEAFDLFWEITGESDTCILYLAPEDLRVMSLTNIDAEMSYILFGEPPISEVELNLKAWIPNESNSNNPRVVIQLVQNGSRELLPDQHELERHEIQDELSQKLEWAGRKLARERSMGSSQLLKYPNIRVRAELITPRQWGSAVLRGKSLVDLVRLEIPLEVSFRLE